MKIPLITPALLAAQARQARTWIDAEKARLTGEIHALMEAIDAPVNAALTAVNGRASSFTITSGTEVRIHAREAEAVLERAGIPQAERIGTIADVVPAGPGAKAYKYAVASTRITLQRGAKGAWFLTGVVRCERYPTDKGGSIVTISEAARDSVVRHALAPFVIRPADTKTEAA